MFVIYDLDGTLSIDKDRQDGLFASKGEAGDRAYQNYLPYHARCAEDPPNQAIMDILLLMVGDGYDVHIWTGRPDTYTKETEWWLRKHLGNANFDQITLRMRPAGDSRSTNDIKGDWLCDYPKLPDLVFDDRAKCVAFWRSLSIPTCQVADNV